MDNECRSVPADHVETEYERERGWSSERTVGLDAKLQSHEFILPPAPLRTAQLNLKTPRDNDEPY